jgi:hypothetical protein
LLFLLQVEKAAQEHYQSLTAALDELQSSTQLQFQQLKAAAKAKAATAPKEEEERAADRQRLEAVEKTVKALEKVCAA